MPKMLTEKLYDFCPENCPHMDISISVSACYMDNESYHVKSNTISCVHERVCVMWANDVVEEQNSKTPNQQRVEQGLPAVAHWLVQKRSKEKLGQWDKPVCSNCCFIHPDLYSISLGELWESLPEKCPHCNCKMVTVKEI